MMNREEVLATLGTIKKKIEGVFPFKDENERDVFIGAMEQVVSGAVSISHEEFARAINDALGTLKNSHTRLRQAMPESMDEIESIRIKDVVSAHMLDGGIGYVRVNQWLVNRGGENTGDEAWEAIQKLGDISSLIIDVRENRGGNSEAASNLAGHFLASNSKFARILVRHSLDTLKLDQDEAIVNAREPFRDTPLVVLTGPKCLSANEMFILMLKDTGRAITIGEKTGGGSGNPDLVPLELGGVPYELTVSTWRMQRLSGEELESKGIIPDIEVQTSGTSGEDATLKRAVEYLTNR